MRELLQARSGVYHAALYETPEMAKMRPPRGSHPPGTFWYYNNWDFNALGTIYEHATGSGIFEALDQKIAKPIGIAGLPATGWQLRPRRSVYPPRLCDPHERAGPGTFCTSLSAQRQLGRTPDRFWEWVRRARVAIRERRPEQGYGYLWWIGFLGGAVAPTVTLPEGSFLAEGAGGQYALVVPTLDLVVVHRVDRDTALHPNRHMRTVWSRLFWLILKAEGYH